MRWTAAVVLAGVLVTACSDSEDGLPVSRWEHEGQFGDVEVVFADDGTYVSQAEMGDMRFDCIGEWTRDGDQIDVECVVDGKSMRREYRLAGDDVLIRSGEGGDDVYKPSR